MRQCATTVGSTTRIRNNPSREKPALRLYGSDQGADSWRNSAWYRRCYVLQLLPVVSLLEGMGHFVKR